MGFELLTNLVKESQSNNNCNTNHYYVRKWSEM